MGAGGEVWGDTDIVRTSRQRPKGGGTGCTVSVFLVCDLVPPLALAAGVGRMKEFAKSPNLGLHQLEGEAAARARGLGAAGGR